MGIQKHRWYNHISWELPFGRAYKNPKLWSTIDKPTKEKLSTLSRTFGAVYANKEYNTLTLDINLK